MAEPTNEDARARALAVSDLEDIQSLRSSPAFERYFERRLQDELKKLADLLLYDIGQTKDSLWETRLRFTAKLEVSKMMSEDEAGCKNMLSEIPPKE